MLKLLTLAAPMLMRGRAKLPIKEMVGRLLIYFLVFGGLFCVLAALFVWIMKNHTLEAAFLAIGAILLFGALCLMMSSRRARQQVKEAVTPESVEGDFLAKYLPESVSSDPLFQRVSKEISSNPIPAAAAAVAIGILLSREIFDRD